MDTNLQTVALAKLVGEKTKTFIAARAALTEGTHNVDCTIRVTGTLHVGTDYDTAPTVSIPLKETMALFIAYSGITREHAINVLTRAMTDAIAANGKGKGALAEKLTVVEETMTRVEEDIIALLPRQDRKGPVKASLNYTAFEVGMMIA